MRAAFRVAALTIALALSTAPLASAQTPQTDSTASVTDEAPSLGQVLKATVVNVRALPKSENLLWLAAGAAGAAATHPADARATRTLADSHALHESLKGGALIGGTPFELGAAFATYAIGRALNDGRVARVGANLLQAQLMAESLTIGVKQATRRARPSGSGFSFPSGHTTVSFASADVLARTFGWKAGVAAYAVASYVAASRVQNQRHYLSDVVFGAALGTVAGRTVTVGRFRRLAVTPVVAAGRAGFVLAVEAGRGSPR